MLKLNASYSKKVPASEQYSSQSYHASLELELSDGNSPEDVRLKIHETFNLVRNAVENEINSSITESKTDLHVKTEMDTLETASEKQVKYLLDLARQYKFDINSVIKSLRLENVYYLSRTQCSCLIDRILGKTNKAL